MKINPLFLIDFYKAGHRKQYPANTSMVYSNFTPRSNKYAYKDSNEVVVFGVQYLIKEYLINQWNEGFFNRDKQEVLEEYKSLMDIPYIAIDSNYKALKESEVTAEIIDTYIQMTSINLLEISKRYEHVLELITHKMTYGQKLIEGADELI